jgi:hypothetical protein
MLSRVRSGLLVAAVALSVLLAGLASLAQPTSETAQELRVSWEVDTAPSPGALGPTGRAARGDRLVVLERWRNVVYAPRQRRPEIAAGQIVVTVVDAAGNERGRTIIPDPRILRAEFPDETGALQGVQQVRPNAEFLVTLPDHPSVRELRIHEPRWNGSEFELDLLGAVALD